MGKLQMDWLRSEDLKEEKNVTAPITIIAGAGTLCILGFSTGSEAYHWDMRRLRPQFPALSTSDRAVAADVLFRDEPAEEEDEDEDDGKEKEDDDENGDGYSE